MKILISGHNGFVGKHLLRKLKYINSDHDIEFLTKSTFKSHSSLVNIIAQNDIIFHFAGINRDVDEETVFNKNNIINDSLFNALEEVKFKGRLLFTSSIQEESDSLYGKAKKKARLKFKLQSDSLGYIFHGIKAPNIFGPFGKPNYNSFIATFSKMLINNKSPKINNDNILSLIYIGDFIDEIIKIIYTDTQIELNSKFIHRFRISDILKKLYQFKELYVKNGEIPNINSHFDLCLFNTFRSYQVIEKIFPRKHKKFEDKRGLFSELIRCSSEGQTSYSVTMPGELRGNHFHTKKIERFSVIAGKARIQLREILSEKKIEFILDGQTPSYIDMPVWYTHNIKNIGEEDLVTIFWTNEHYKEDSSDTYIEIV